MPNLTMTVLFFSAISLYVGGVIGRYFEKNHLAEEAGIPRKIEKGKRRRALASYKVTALYIQGTFEGFVTESEEVEN